MTDRQGRGADFFDDPRKMIFWASFLVAACTFWVFHPAIGNGFVNLDDAKNILENPHFRGFSWKNLLWMGTAFHSGHYIPLTWLSFALDHALWGLKPQGYHLTNVLLHSLNAGLFHSVLIAFLGRAQANPISVHRLVLAAAPAALLFSLHPLRVESVAWATERRDVLSIFFLLLSFTAYLKHVDRPRTAWLWLSVALYLCSLLSKALGITWPVLLLLLDIYPLGRWKEKEKILREKVPYFFLAAAFGALAAAAQTAAGAALPLTTYDPLHRLAQMAYGAAFYVHKTLLPLGLSPLYRLSPDFDVWSWPFVASAAGVLAVSGVLFKYRKPAPALLTGWIFYLVGSLPTSGLFQSGLQLTADRYSYLPALCFSTLAAAGLARLGKAKTGATAAALIVVLAALCPLARRQISVWKDSRSLWTRVLELQGPSAEAVYGLGLALEEENDAAGAMALYKESLALDPTFVPALYGLASGYHRGGEKEKAKNIYELLLRIEPNHVKALNNLGVLLVERGHHAQARIFYERALALDPASEKIRNNLAKAGQAAP